MNTKNPHPVPPPEKNKPDRSITQTSCSEHHLNVLWTSTESPLNIQWKSSENLLNIRETLSKSLSHRLMSKECSTLESERKSEIFLQPNILKSGVLELFNSLMGMSWGCIFTVNTKIRNKILNYHVWVFSVFIENKATKSIRFVCSNVTLKFNQPLCVVTCCPKPK